MHCIFLNVLHERLTFLKTQHEYIASKAQHKRFAFLKMGREYIAFFKMRNLNILFLFKTQCECIAFYKMRNVNALHFLKCTAFMMHILKKAMRTLCVFKNAQHEHIFLTFGYRYPEVKNIFRDIFTKTKIF